MVRAGLLLPLLLIAACSGGRGGEEEEVSRDVELSFVEFGVKGAIFGPRTEIAGAQPYSIVVIGAEKSGTCDAKPDELPAGARAVIVALEPGATGRWPPFPAVCGIDEPEAPCQARVYIREMASDGKLKKQWIASRGGIVTVLERTPDSFDLEVRAPIPASGAADADVEMLELRIVAALCEDACVCLDERAAARDPCACE